MVSGLGKYAVGKVARLARNCSHSARNPEILSGGMFTVRARWELVRSRPSSNWVIVSNLSLGSSSPSCCSDSPISANSVFAIRVASPRAASTQTGETKTVKMLAVSMLIPVA